MSTRPCSVWRSAWWRSVRWRRRAAAVLSVLALVAVTTGIALLRSAPTTAAGAHLGTDPVTSTAGVAGDASRTSVPWTAAGEPDPAESPQPPGSVSLAEEGPAALVRTALTSDGTLPIPTGTDQAAWWGAEFGADQGVALVAGHVNWHGRVGPFTALLHQRPGDVVTVRDPDGRTWTYRVVTSLNVGKEDLGAQAPRLFTQDGPHRLALVTCDGDYLGGTSGYSDNRIVIAELVSGP